VRKRSDISHDEVFVKLSGVVDASEALSVSEQRHVEFCLQCQAELVRYRKLLRALHDLRTTVIQPTPGLLANILDNLGERGERRAVRSIMTGKKVAYTGGLAVATVAGVTGALLLAGRARGKGKSVKAA
jgi:hypothetical protein